MSLAKRQVEKKLAADAFKTALIYIYIYIYI